MGVDCTANLLRPVNINDVAEIIAVLLGNKHETYKISGSDGVFHRAEGFKFVVHENNSEHYSGSGSIIVEDQITDVGPFETFFMLERKDGIHLRGRNNTRKIAIYRRLVDIFGGQVDYCDSDDIDVNYEMPKPKYDTMPEDGAEWDFWFWQILMNNLPPLTKEEIYAWEDYSVYHLKGGWK